MSQAIPTLDEVRLRANLKDLKNQLKQITKLVATAEKEVAKLDAAVEKVPQMSYLFDIYVKPSYPQKKFDSSSIVIHDGFEWDYYTTYAHDGVVMTYIGRVTCIGYYDYAMAYKFVSVDDKILLNKN